MRRLGDDDLAVLIGHSISEMLSNNRESYDMDCIRYYRDWLQLPYDPGIEISS